jgi:hypothetical protein
MPFALEKLLLDQRLPLALALNVDVISTHSMSRLAASTPSARLGYVPVADMCLNRGACPPIPSNLGLEENRFDSARLDYGYEQSGEKGSN